MINPKIKTSIYTSNVIPKYLGYPIKLYLSFDRYSHTLLLNPQDDRSREALIESGEIILDHMEYILNNLSGTPISMNDFGICKKDADRLCAIILNRLELIFPDGAVVEHNYV